MGMYAYPPAAMYAGFNPSSMVNPAVMSGHGSSSGNSASQAGSAAQQGAAAGTGADGSSNAPGHYMSYPGHPHFFQPGMLPNMMQGSGASGVHYQQGSTQHPSMHSAGNYGQFAQNVASAANGKKTAAGGAKQGRPKKKKEAVDPMAVAAAGAHIMGGHAPMMVAQDVS